MTWSQIEVNTTARPRVIFYSAGVPVDLDSGVPVVAGTLPDGTVITPTPTAAHVGSAGSGTYEVTNLAARTIPTLIRLDWTGPVGSLMQTLTTYLEVVGGLLFTLADARAVDGGAITTAIASNEQIMDKRTAIGDRLQRVCGVSFFPRFARETRNGDGSCQLGLYHHRASQLLSVKVNGAVKDVAGYTLQPSGILETTSNYLPSGSFPPGRGNVVVEYVHGWPQVAGPVRDAALKIARVQLVPSNIGDRWTSMTTDQGTIFLATPGRGQFQPFGIPEADAALRDFDESDAAAVG